MVLCALVCVMSMQVMCSTNRNNVGIIEKLIQAEILARKAWMIKADNSLRELIQQKNLIEFLLYGYQEECEEEEQRRKIAEAELNAEIAARRQQQLQQQQNVQRAQQQRTLSQPHEPEEEGNPEIEIVD